MSKTNEPMNTPAMKQFTDIKAKYPDSILFFRMGDFYEMFGEDAVIASQILDIALTRRNNIQMCGFPYHATENHISRLIAANKKVVICEQFKSEEMVGKILQREVVRVITPGTVVEENILKGFKNNYLSIVFVEQSSVFLAFADISTSDLYYTSFTTDQLDKIKNTFSKFSPSEIVILASHQATFSTLLENTDSLVTVYKDENLQEIVDSSVDPYTKLKQFLQFVLTENFKHHNFDFYSPVILDESEYLQIDEQSARNLDLIENQTTRDRQFTLFSVLNKCSTGIGKRTLLNRILFPYKSTVKIYESWNQIDLLSANPRVKRAILQLLASTSDIERILSRFRAGKALPRDFTIVCKTIDIVNSLQELLATIRYPFDYNKENLTKVYDFMKERLLDGELPAVLGGSDFIKSGYSFELDSAREAKTKGKDWILDIEEKEKLKTGLNTLKIRYNKVVGYYIELSRNQAGSAPKYFIKKQTLVTSERFTFKELEEIERKILEADEIISEIEKKEFDSMIQFTLSYFEDFIHLSKNLGELDFILSLTLCKEDYNWVKPAVNAEGKISLEEARHPVVEKYLPIGDKFVTNSITLDRNLNSMAILTGPNMAGKSTFMRQIALCQILFQIGSFVPATKASLCIVDKIFTRIGSADNLTSGESTFFLEMKETAYILKNQTSDSLILFDEIGRGTSTFDGLSLAWSIIEYLNKLYEPNKKVKTIFATHYHELTELERETGIFNLYMDTVEKEDEVIFMRKVKKGKAKKSFGVYVAKLAGLPEPIIARSKEVLAGLESKKKVIQFKSSGDPALFALDIDKPETSLDEAKKLIDKININQTTPIEALQILSRIKDSLKS
jgi:DNA mismatch repair protein MutS